VMGDIFAMQRANGDWFTHEVKGRLRLPLFHTVHDAFLSRFRNFGMMLFKPVTFDDRMLKKFDEKRAKTMVDFCLIDDPFVSLNRGQVVERTQLSLLMSGKA